MTRLEAGEPTAPLARPARFAGACPFAHHGLMVHAVAFEAMVRSVELSKQIPRGHRSMADQLKRAATGVVAAIVEGANRRTNPEKADKFAQARTEAGEAAAWSIQTGCRCSRA